MISLMPILSSVTTLVLFDPIIIKGKATVKYNKKYGGDVSNVKLTGSGTGTPVTEEPY
jgi:hypothetical protein